MSDVRFAHSNIHDIDRIDIGPATLNNWLRFVLWHDARIVAAIEVERPVKADWIDICTEISREPMPTEFAHYTLEFFEGADVRFNRRDYYAVISLEQGNDGASIFTTPSADIVWHI